MADTLADGINDTQAILSAIFVAKADSKDGSDGFSCKRKNRSHGVILFCNRHN
jgi:hypothetical protein